MALLDAITRSRLLRDVTLVSGGTAVGQAIALLVTPLLTRLYSPDVYGQASIFLSVIAVLVPTLTLTLPLGIVLPRTDHEARHLAAASVLFATISAVFITLLASFFMAEVARFTGIHEPAVFIWLIVPAILAGALQAIGQQWLIRHRDYKASAVAIMLGAIVGALVRTAFGLLLPISAGLVIGSAATNTMHGFPALMRRGVTGSGVIPRVRLTTRRLGYLTRRYGDFIRYRVPNHLLNSGSSYLPVIALGVASPQAAGFFALAKWIVDAPTTLIGDAVAGALSPRIVETIRTGRSLFPLLIKSTALLTGIGAPIFGTVFVFGPILFKVIFGAAWEPAGEYASLLAVWVFVGFANRPAVTAAAPLHIQSALLVYEVIATAMKIVAMYIGLKLYGDDLLAVKLFCVFGAVSYLGLIIWILLEARRYDRTLARLTT